MHIDVEDHIRSVHREVDDGIADGHPTRVVSLSRRFDTEPGDLWGACTDPDRLRRWFLPVTGDLRPGGRYQLEGNAGGRIRSCQPVHEYSATWEFADDVSWISVQLKPEKSGGTTLTLGHAAVVGDHWRTYGPGATGVGWDGAFLGLTLYLSASSTGTTGTTGSPDSAGAAGSSGAGIDPEEYAAWSASPDGLRFVTLAGEAWRDADIAGGEDPDQARRAAEQTIAFYTGAPQD